jgi:hypothetical protein
MSDKINDLKEKIRVTSELLYYMKHELNTLIKTKQNNCTHDEFTGEHNGDTHSSGYYYTCTNCEYSTLYKPDAKKINYS